ncbi:hypothetical protein A7E78_13080 [Syntrophotalea acetylenivorans]|uniref:tRNA(Met) cytidine acetate ligase n=1 Tax=Syntrophotalea acetylenivorans TaxID=1842532 RepID=A0A1L3GRX4_9BACT|nr:nucleotidyltransferase [Syntrophotalea acetylenivorans]APG28682.1 hypothetical protein A7E78_13080 [Syntrophotalea acetylenivorans]
MRAVGLITEYNPFHNGHLHHLRESLKQADAEVSVAVMSGHFLQRGEPALVDKWRRTEMALRAGVDVVVELPFAFACQSAPYFARGAVQCLNALGGVKSLCFGSEAGELKPLQRCAELLQQRQGELAIGIAAQLRQGVHYADARAALVAKLSGDDQMTTLLQTPNNILALEYLQALRDTGSAMQSLTIPRLGAGYHEFAATGSIASATGIRQRLAEGQSVAEFLPAACVDSLQQTLTNKLTADANSLHQLLLGQIFRGRDDLQKVYQVEDGLDRRLADAAPESNGWEDLVDRIKVRQLTRTRVQRILCYVLNAVPSAVMADAIEAGPLYLHLLGCSDRGRRFLSSSRKQRSLPLIANFSRVYATLKRFHGPESGRLKLALAMLEIDLRATRNYTLLLPGWAGGNRNRDFFQEVLSD